MDLHEALYTTRAMRRLKPDPIPLDVQARILDAAVRAPNIGQDWRFLLVDDPALMAQLATLYRDGMSRMAGPQFAAMLKLDTPLGRMARSGDHLARHFAAVPLLLLGFSRNRTGGAVYPALWSAMLAARAEGVGATMTGMLQTYHAEEVCALLGVPADGGWHLHGVIALGYPTGKWGIAARTPAHEVAARNSWAGDLGFAVPEPLWPGTRGD